MRTWIIPIALVIGGLWVWWVRRRIRAAYLERLVRAAKGSAQRATSLTVTWQLTAAVIATLLLVVAIIAQASWHAPYVRIPLLLLVIAFYVPLTTLASGRDATVGKQRKVQVRKSVQQRLSEAGASPDVSHAITRASKPFSYYGVIVFVVAAVLITWHE